MRRHLALFLILIVIIFALAACHSNGYYDDGFEDGYHEGYYDGHLDARIEYEDDYSRGYDDGHSEGYWEGFNEGYDEGFDNNNGYEVGYEDGENDGYYAGATYTCLFFGDVDRAFQSANNGCAWHSFIDAYDQYISNIFDDDETRSELFWSLISVTLSGDATEEEIELLISTFGENLFIRNGVNLRN